jgi:DNA mismatch repair protein MutL
MPTITRLPDLLISQIAAGEVVERPASVLKELLENSLDAGSKAIQVHLEEGGIKLIRITDDGCGIAKEQLALALTRHATSKIVSLEDLEHVATLGFRGEALASVASVARLTLSSREQWQQPRLEAEGRNRCRARTGGADGWHCRRDARSLLQHPGPAQVPQGRGHRIRPLRRRRSSRLAMTRPDVAFSLTHNGRNLFQLAPSDSTRRIADILGDDFIGAARRWKSRPAR